MAVALAESGANIISVSASLEAHGSQVEKDVQATGRSFKAYKADFPTGLPCMPSSHK